MDKISGEFIASGKALGVSTTLLVNGNLYAVNLKKTKNGVIIAKCIDLKKCLTFAKTRNEALDLIKDEISKLSSDPKNWITPPSIGKKVSYKVKK